MAIKDYLSQAIVGIKADREKQILAVKDKVMREKVIPYNEDMDKACTKAVEEKATEAREKIEAIKKQFELDKQELETACKTKKAEHEKTVMDSETSLVTIEYDKTISKLQSLQENVKE